MSNQRVIQMVVDHNTNTIRPTNIDEFNFILQYFQDQSVVTVTIEPFVRPKTKSQVGIFHAFVSEIAKETGNDKETVKSYLKNNYGARLESGELMSITDYSTTDMNHLIEQTRLFMIQDLGMNVPTVEEYSKKNIK